MRYDSVEIQQNIQPKYYITLKKGENDLGTEMFKSPKSEIVKKK